MRTNLNFHESAIETAPSRISLMTSVAALFALIIVQFSDVIPSVFGGYEDQRFFLALVCGLLVIAPVFAITLKSPAPPLAIFAVASPTLILCLSFIILSLPFYSQPYVWVEPGMYVFFFLASLASGMHLAWSGNGVSYSINLSIMVAATCLIYGLGSVTVYVFATADGITSLVGYIPWGFVNMRYWSHIATWSIPLIPLAVLLGPLKDFRSWRVGVLIGGGMWWWILFITTARGSILAILLGAAIVVICFGRKSMPWLKQMLACLIVGGVVWLILSVAIPSLADEAVSMRPLKKDGSGRLPLFLEAWQMSLQNIPLGMGPQSWLTHDVLTEAYSFSPKLGHPHNMYLMWAAEYGWMLVVFFALVAIQAIRYFLLKRRVVLRGRQVRPQAEKLLLFAGFTASVSGALFHAGVSAVFLAPGSMLIGLFVLIAFWALIIPSRSPSMVRVSEANRRLRFNVFVALVLGAMILVLWTVWLSGMCSYYTDMRHDEVVYKNLGEGMLPRFWSHGNFPRR